MNKQLTKEQKILLEKVFTKTMEQYKQAILRLQNS